MRVLHADTGRTMRGGQWQVIALLRGLRKRGIEQVLLSPEGSPLGELARDEGFVWEKITRRALKQVGLIHAHDAKAHTLAWLAGAERLVVSRRVAFAVKRGIFSRWKYAKPALFLAVSRFVKTRLMESGIPESKIRVVYDGVDCLPRASAFRIVTPAFDDPLKGGELIRQAAALASVEVHFSKQLQPDLLDARAFVYVSQSEGLGSAILLAQSAGVPVIASNIGGIPEIVEHGVTGILVDNTVASLAAALLALKTDSYAEMGAAGRRQAQERFSVDCMAEATLAAYREVADV